MVLMTLKGPEDTDDELDMSWIPRWPSLGILIIICLEWGTTRSLLDEEDDTPRLTIVAPSAHVALAGDLTVFVVGSAVERPSSPSSGQSAVEDADHAVDDDGTVESPTTPSTFDDPFLLRVLYLLDDISELIGEIPLARRPSRTENISVTVPCGFFSRGGIYILQLQYKDSVVPAPTRSTAAGTLDIEPSSVLDVKWPIPSIQLESQQLHTYPAAPVLVTVGYNGISCAPLQTAPPAVYLLQLVYCGPSIATCYPKNDTRAQVLYFEEIRGFVSPRVVVLRCEFFGLPGNYAVRMKAADVNPNAPNKSVYIKVDWSEEFALTVHARSIYPCEGGSGGVSVLFQYPACRLQGDRVRVYGRLRADVTSLASPSSLHYVSELRSMAGRHSLTFDCDLFTEKYVEYCFVYVSQAINGAMADVRMACVPTFPFQESDVAGWGPWSPWSPCSTSCFGGIRNRYRFCDTPPPKYGAKFCQGKAVETEFCGTARFDDYKSWSIGQSDCRRGSVLAADRPEVAAEIGAQCRCGCIVALREQPSRKIVGANTQACPGRSFWLLQARTDYVIGLHLDQLQFPCPGQYFRARDGDSLSADLLTDVAFDRRIHATETVISTGQNLLLEFFSDELTASGEACIGGFLAHAAVLQKQYMRNGTLTVVPFEVNSAGADDRGWTFWKPAHLATASLLILIFFVSIFLTLQFVIKYRKYRIAEDLDNSSDTSELVPGRSKSMSTSTLISDVPSMIEVPRKSSHKEAFYDVEEQYNSTETLTGQKEGSNLSSSTLKLRDTLESSSDKTLTSVSDKFLPVSCVVAHNQPEVKFAYPVKLRTLDCGSPEEKSEKSGSGEGKLESTMSFTDSLNMLKFRQYRRNEYPDSKESSPGSVLSTSSALRAGKETKDRRNRERLLQGPGSEFSLANPDSELELDYYDYNVANASAVPGSYLGMDPAFLVWIPPLDSEDLLFDDVDSLRRRRSSVLTVDAEGACLTPSEYRRLRLSLLEDSRLDYETSVTSEELAEGERSERGSGTSEGTDEGQRNPLTDRHTPPTKIPEDSSDKISLESLSAPKSVQTCVIPNRREESDSIKEKRDKASGRTKKEEIALETRTQNCPKWRNEGKEVRYRDFVEAAQTFGGKKEPPGIPMIELSGSPLRRIVEVRRVDNRDVEACEGTEGTDYGIETCMKGSLFGGDIKFVDEDDEFVEQRVGA